ncbi:helix-turn-helix transcriptional regulator [Gemmata sp. JC673]|uniref:Helix-turn-helix transcriptional regulator n=1 Tax=Gemmata algarum TaxID=2975278 RepID=A0ABU5EQH0_9BACT|nr:helix-turn-helix transcriptional regulator [Gemmata algarum]MDY3557601.1 helix-turn-helix transcriptional regulator [Gemmata algarum]
MAIQQIPCPSESSGYACPVPTGAEMATFRETLRTLLVQKDIKLIDMAKRAGISYAAARAYTTKNSKRKPSVPHLIAICDALEISLDTFRKCEDLQTEKADLADDEGDKGDSGKS